MTKVQLPKWPIGPFPAMLVGAKVDDRPNYATVGACGVVCLDPILYVSLKASHHTTRGVRESGFFSVNIPSAKLIKETDFCGMNSGKDTDKSKLFTTFYGDPESAPMIQECPVNIICKVFRSIEVKDFEMFFGEITAVYADDTCLSMGKVDPSKIDPILLMGSNYLSLGETLGTVFQEGKTLPIIPK